MLETPRHVLKDQNVKGLSLVTAPIGTMSRDVQWPDKERHLFCLGEFVMIEFYKTEHLTN